MTRVQCKQVLPPTTPPPNTHSLKNFSSKQEGKMLAAVYRSPYMHFRGSLCAHKVTLCQIKGSMLIFLTPAVFPASVNTHAVCFVLWYLSNLCFIFPLGLISEAATFCALLCSALVPSQPWTVHFFLSFIYWLIILHFPVHLSHWLINHSCRNMVI